MPGDAADWFRNEMRHLLQPHAVSGLLTFDVMVAFETGVPGG